MKVKVESVVEGKYGYDSVYVKMNNENVCVSFDKKDNVSRYNGKYVDIDNVDGKYVIREFVENKKK